MNNNLHNITKLLEKYNLSIDELEKLIKQKVSKKDILVPVSVFYDKLSPFESIVKYLFENKKKGYSDIGSLLQKDRQVIYATYKRASKKVKKKFSESSDLWIPIAELSSNKYSIAELVVAYLKKSDLRNSEIAELLGKDSRTVWTWYNRYKKK